MSRAEPSAADLGSFLDLLTAPAFRWSQTESDDETDRLWLQLCRVILEDIPEEMVKWLQAIDPPHHAPALGGLPVESQARTIDRLTLLRAGQKYWGVGVTAGKDLEEIATWAGILETDGTISALRRVTQLIRERRPALEPALFRHATERAARRIDSWLGSISPREADVVVKRFGLRGQPRVTLAKVGESHGVSRARVQQIEAGLLRQLGPAVAGELHACSRAGSRLDALNRAFQALPTRPGEDVHCIDDILNLAALDDAWWPCGIAMLTEDVNGSIARVDQHLIREWLIHRPDAILLDSRMNFMRRRSENKSPYITAARKLLAIHEVVSIAVVHEAVLDTWRSELWRECMLSVDWLRAFLRSSTLAVKGDCLERTGLGASSDGLSQSEQQLLGALQDLGGVAPLDELRERLPGLRRQGSTLSQTLYGRTPIVQRLGPSIFGIRGAAHDPERVAALEDHAVRRGHPWLNRGGWKRDARRSLQYRLPSKRVPPSRIRLPNDITDALLGDNGRLGPLIWRLPDGLQHSIGVQVSSAGTHLTGVRPALDRLFASGGDTINVRVNPDGSWEIALAEEAPAESVVIRMGRGWTSVSL